MGTFMLHRYVEMRSDSECSSFFFQGVYIVRPCRDLHEMLKSVCVRAMSERSYNTPISQCQIGMIFGSPKAIEVAFCSAEAATSASTCRPL